MRLLHGYDIEKELNGETPWSTTISPASSLNRFSIVQCFFTFATLPKLHTLKLSFTQYPTFFGVPILCHAETIHLSDLMGCLLMFSLVAESLWGCTRVLGASVVRICLDSAPMQWAARLCAPCSRYACKQLLIFCLKTLSFNFSSSLKFVAIYWKGIVEVSFFLSFDFLLTQNSLSTETFHLSTHDI